VQVVLVEPLAQADVHTIRDRIDVAGRVEREAEVLDRTCNLVREPVLLIERAAERDVVAEGIRDLRPHAQAAADPTSRTKKRRSHYSPLRTTPRTKDHLR